MFSVDRTSLRIWRGGAVRTPTRWHFRAVGNAKLCACPFCGHARASARHFWQECHRLDAMRSELELEYGIQTAWWLAQPACTSKSGWVTTHAHVNAAQRVRMQIASCRLGIAIIGLDPVAALLPAAASASELAFLAIATSFACGCISPSCLCSSTSSSLPPSLGLGILNIRRRVTGKRAP